MNFPDKTSMRSLCFILIFVCPYVYAEPFFLHSFQNSKKVELIKIDGIYFSKNCEEKTCEAFKSLSKKVDFKIQSKIRRHPASLTCFNLGGKNILLRDEKKNEWDFCIFKDQSMINSWALHKKVNN